MEEKNLDSKCLVVFKNKCAEEKDKKGNDSSGIKSSNFLSKRRVMKKLNIDSLNISDDSDKDISILSLKIIKGLFRYWLNINISTIKIAILGACVGGKWGGAGGWIAGSVAQLVGVTFIPFMAGCAAFWASLVGVPKKEIDDFAVLIAKHFGTEGLFQPQRGVVGGVV